MPKPKSALARQIKELQDSAPRDFDPEANENVQSSGDESDSDISEDGLAGTEHYAEVGKSKLRQPEEISLGPKYAGSKVSREALLNEDEEDEESDSEIEEDGVQYAELDADIEINEEDGDIDSDAAFGDSDDEKFKEFTFRGSGKPRVPIGIKKRPTASDFMSDNEEEQEVNEDDLEGSETDEDILDVDIQHGSGSDEGSDEVEAESEEEEEGEEGSDSNSDQEPGSGEDSEASSDDEVDEDEQERRAELRKIMGEDEQSVVAAVSQAAKSDAAKGDAIRVQRKAFDSLLSVRMTLQKALVATNSMVTLEEKGLENLNHPYEAAEEAAIKLWNTLDGLRQELSKSSNAKTGQKRKRGIDVSTSSADIWERMQKSEISMIDNRQTTLDKWSAKVRGTSALPLSRKLNPTASEQSITSVLQDHLASSDRLVQRTKIPRSCAPIQRDAKLAEDPNIYDDGNFYQLLLKELVDQRRVDSMTAPAMAGEAEKVLQWTAVKEVKTRKVVDTKASKGRKLRYTVHEKLQNFMAPEDRTSWEQDAVDRLFGSLLGQRMTLGEEEAKEDEVDDEEISPEEESLMLFRS